MALGTNLTGRLRNTDLPKSHGLMPLYEAVVNSMQAIEEAGVGTSKGEITVEIVRDAQPALSFEEKPGKRGPDPSARILGFKVTDNGIGFDDANFKAFETLDTDHKAVKGCRGVGRLLWLKAFSKVYVDSVHVAVDGGLERRKFTFDEINAVGSVSNDPVDPGTERATTVHLHGFKEVYREASSKTLDAIAKALFEHCLWYFIRPGGAPDIRLVDGDESRGMDEVCAENMLESSSVQTVMVKDVAFDLTHVKLHASSTQTHKIAYGAANRLVIEEPINGKVQGLFGRIQDEKGGFTYGCYVCSTFLDSHVRSDRTALTIDENREGWTTEGEISMNDIRKAVLEAVEAYLSPLLEENKRVSKERVDCFIKGRAPRYLPIIARIPADRLNVDPNMSDRDLEGLLHRQLSDYESRMMADGHDIMTPKGMENPEDYRKRLDNYLEMVEDIKKSDLAGYVSHRKVILDLLGKAIERTPAGGYSREDLIHRLIMPMGVVSTEIDQIQSNLWLVDERLAFHNYLASDKTLRSMPITGSESTKEPDILALSVYDKPLLVAEGTRLPLASITVIELKRPCRNDAAQGDEKDPIEQALMYLDRVRKGEVRTAAGRPIPNSSDIPGFCYVIADLTPSIQQRTRIHQLRPTSDKLGYFGYSEPFNAYIEVISFDRLLNAARERNRAFFDKLGLPTN
jgi:hypothetical protein